MGTGWIAVAEYAIGESPLRPAAVEVLPDDVVAAMVARKEGELEALRLELKGALDTAERAERRLSAYPAAAFIGDDFEADVLADAARRAAEMRGFLGPSGNGDSSRVTVASPAERPRPSVVNADATASLTRLPESLADTLRRVEADRPNALPTPLVSSFVAQMLAEFRPAPESGQDVPADQGQTTRGRWMTNVPVYGRPAGDDGEFEALRLQIKGS